MGFILLILLWPAIALLYGKSTFIGVLFHFCLEIFYHLWRRFFSILCTTYLFPCYIGYNLNNNNLTQITLLKTMAHSVHCQVFGFSIVVNFQQVNVL